MKYIFLLLMLSGSLVACKKNPVTPEIQMQYTNFNDSVIRYNQQFSVDLNKDGVGDFGFTVSQIYDADGVHDQYRIVASVGNRVLLNTNAEPKLHAFADIINASGGNGYTWVHSSGLMIEKIMSTGLDYWQGAWKDKQRRYIAVRITKDGKDYYGWFNISHTASRVIVHDGAISKVADADVVAGK